MDLRKTASCFALLRGKVYEAMENLDTFMPTLTCRQLVGFEWCLSLRPMVRCLKIARCVSFKRPILCEPVSPEQENALMPLGCTCSLCREVYLVNISCSPGRFLTLLIRGFYPSRDISAFLAVIVAVGCWSSLIASVGLEGMPSVQAGGTVSESARPGLGLTS